jgi:hypothetical protein
LHENQSFSRVLRDISVVWHEWAVESQSWRNLVGVGLQALAPNQHTLLRSKDR